MNVSLEDAKTAIMNLGVTVVDIEVVGQHHHFQSFRLRVKKAEMDRIKDPDFSSIAEKCVDIHKN